MEYSTRVSKNDDEKRCFLKLFGFDFHSSAGNSITELRIDMSSPRFFLE